MKKSTKKWLVGSGIVAAGAAAVGAAFRTVSKYMVELAMDRECPKTVEKGMAKVSGSPENKELMAAASEAMQKLENAGCETVEIQSHDGILIVISMLLTLLAGIIPSRSAAKKDPVVALRSE